MALAEELEKILEQPNKFCSSSDFQQQRKNFHALKDTLNKAGYIYGDRYEIPLMHQLGVYDPKPYLEGLHNSVLRLKKR